jgi:hypothetical protein
MKSAQLHEAVAGEAVDRELPRSDALCRVGDFSRGRGVAGCILIGGPPAPGIAAETAIMSGEGDGARLRQDMFMIVFNTQSYMGMNAVGYSFNMIAGNKLGFRKMNCSAAIA